MNLDELLKQELGELKVDPPSEVWNSLSNNLNSSTVQASHASKQVSGAIKGGTIGGKIITVAAIAVTTIAAITGYQLLTNAKADSTQMVSSSSELTQDLSEPSEWVEASPKVDALEELIAPEPETNTTKPQPQPEQQKQRIVETKTIRPVEQERIAVIDEIVEEPQTINTDAEPDTDALQQTTNASSTESSTAGSNSTVELAKPIGKDTSQPAYQPSDEPILTTESNDSTNKGISISNEGGISLQNTSDFSEINVANVFTPFNNDGINDFFVIECKEELVFYEVKILDGFGKLVFESSHKNNVWDGINMYNGTRCEEGNYILAFRYQTKSMQTAKVYNGTILLRLKD